MSKKHLGSSVDDFLKKENIFEEAQAQAIKEVVAWQLAKAMKKKKISKARMAVLLKTSRSQVDRVLDPKRDITLSTLQRAAALVGQRVGRILCCALVLILGATSSHARSRSRKDPGKDLTLEQTISRIRPFIVEISCDFTYLPDETARIVGAPFFRIPLGTGLLVDKGNYVVTAAHVVGAIEKVPDNPAISVNGKSYALGPKQCDVAKFSPDSEGSRSNASIYRFTTVEVDVSHDLTLLKMAVAPSDIGSSHLQFCSRRPHDGEAIAVSGYPLSSKVLVTTSGAIASSWSVAEQLVLVPPGFGAHSGAKDIYLADVHVNGGNSGGPVYLKSSAAVIGVVVSFENAPVMLTDQTPATLATKEMIYNSGLAQIVPISYVDALLTKHQISWDEACLNT